MELLEAQNMEQIESKIDELSQQMQSALDSADMAALGRLVTERKRQESLLKELQVSAQEDEIFSWTERIQSNLNDIQIGLNHLGFTLSVYWKKGPNGDLHVQPVVKSSPEVVDMLRSYFVDTARPSVIESMAYQFIESDEMHGIIVNPGKPTARTLKDPSKPRASGWKLDGGPTITLQEAFYNCATDEQRTDDAQFITDGNRSSSNALRGKVVTSAGYTH